MSDTQIPIRKLDVLEMTVTFHTTRELRLRMWIGTRLIRLAARVMGCDLNLREQQP